MTSELPPLIAESATMRRAVRLAREFAGGDLPILLLAPTGCGKELLAQHIHCWSGRRGPLVDINCAALPEQLVESELFGHCAQAFTGARQTKPGLIEVASGGTLFLDEIASLPLGPQAKLLRVLDTQEVRRVGETVNRRVRFGLVAAAQEDLPTRVAEGAFRLDLYQRVAGVVIPIPPLAERPEDILALAEHFARCHGQTLTPGVSAVLLNYAWPGNVRELRQASKRAGQLAGDGTTTSSAMAEAITLGQPMPRHSPGPPSPVPPLPVRERHHLIAACEAAGWHAGNAAAALGISRPTLYRHLRHLGLSLRAIKRARLMHVSQVDAETT